MYVPNYLHLDGFLDGDEHAALIAFAKSQRDELEPSTVNEAETDAIKLDAEFRKSHLLFELEPIWPFFEPRLMALLPHARVEIGLPRFELDYIERQLTAHGDGDFFGLHSDNGGAESDTRLMTFVYYFYEEPKRFEGGELRIYDAVEHDDGTLHPADTFHVVEPANNSIVLFESGAFHEVRTVRTDAGFDGSRFSVNGWFRGRLD